MTFKHLSLAAILAGVVSLSWAVPPITGQWTFENGDLSAKIGVAMEYLGNTGDSTSFGKTSTLGLPKVDGVDKTVLSYPACSPSQGFTFYPSTSASPSGAQDTNMYSILMDICYKSVPTGYAALLQTDPNNNSDADMFVNNGKIGISYQYDGALQANKWHRIVWTMNNRVLKKYIDGVKVGNDQTLDGYQDDRWALYSNGGTALFFTDEDNETASGYCSQIAVYDGVLTDQEVADIGSIAAVADWSLM